MKKSALILGVSALISLGGLASCGGSKADVVLTVYNWEDYIYEGVDEKVFSFTIGYDF